MYFSSLVRLPGKRKPSPIDVAPSTVSRFAEPHFRGPNGQFARLAGMPISQHVWSSGVTHRSAFWFFFPLRVRYAEVDQQGIVFNAHYLTYFDVGITEYMRALGYDYQSQLERTGADFHVIKSLVEYKAPIRFDEEIETAVRTARLGRTSLTFELAIFGKGAGELRASGEIVYVNADRAARKAAPIPSALEALIRAREYGGAPVRDGSPP